MQGVIGGISVSNVIPIRDYNKKDYHEPINFKFIISSNDVEVLEALREFVLDRLRDALNESKKKGQQNNDKVNIE